MTAFHVLVFSDSVPVAVGRFIMEDNVTITWDALQC